MPNSNDRVAREARLRWVPISKTKVSPVAQRELKPYRVDNLAANFDLEMLGVPILSERDGHFYIIDGQHRIEALKEIGYGDQQIQCHVYTGLTEADEAEYFDRYNDSLAVRAFDKFRVRVTAGRADETDIDRIIRANGCTISESASPGAIRAVGTITKIYKRAGGDTLGRTIRIVNQAYGDPGLEAAVIDGIGLLCQRYNGELQDDVAVQRLSSAAGGVNGLLGKAAILQKQTGTQRNHCVAAAAVDIINRGKGGKKLPTWWKQSAS